MMQAPDVMQRFEIGIDELLLLRDHIPGLILPNLAAPARTPHDDLTPLNSLKRNGLLDSSTVLGDPDWTGLIRPPLLSCLALQMTGELLFQADAWSPESQITSSITVTDGVTSTLTISANTDREAASPPLVSIELGDVSNLSTTLAGLIPPTSPTQETFAPVTVGVTQSRALIAALRTGDSRVIEAVAAETQLENATSVLARIAGAMSASFRIRTFTRDGRCVYAGSWFHTSAGWTKFDLNAQNPLSAEDITESATITISPATQAGMEIELLGLVAEGVRDSYVR